MTSTHDNVDPSDLALKNSMKPLQLLVGEGKNAKYIKGTLSLQNSNNALEAVALLSFRRPTAACTELSMGRQGVCSPQYCHTSCACHGMCLLQNSVAVSASRKRVLICQWSEEPCFYRTNTSFAWCLYTAHVDRSALAGLHHLEGFEKLVGPHAQICAGSTQQFAAAVAASTDTKLL